MNVQTAPSGSSTLSVDAALHAQAQPAATDAPVQSALLSVPGDALILLPVSDLVLFPMTIVPLHIVRADFQAGVHEAVRLERPIGVVLQRAPDATEPDLTKLHEIGTSAAVLRYLTANGDTHRVVVKGLRRFRILGYLEGYPFPVAKVEYADEPTAVSAEVEGRARALKQSARETLQLLPQVPPEMAASLEAIADPSQLADVIAGLLDW